MPTGVVQQLGFGSPEVSLFGPLAARYWSLAPGNRSIAFSQKQEASSEKPETEYADTRHIIRKTPFNWVGREEYMHWLDYFIIVTYIAQIYQIFFFAVPSAGSSVEMLLNRKRKSTFAIRHPAAAVVHSIPKMIGTVSATIVVLIVSIIPLLTILSPALNRCLLPFTDVPPSDGLSIISASLMLLGNSLTYIAVATLRARVTFHDFGETARLCTAGIYGLVRNPITLGLVIIFCGFVLARPSVVMLIGLILFMLNAYYRIKMEEVYLEKTFGDKYLRYRDTVGKYVPRVGRRRAAKVKKFADCDIKSHRVDTIQE
jgi:protein-S-isoprenylcysteine O-methyltransferase Ste14